MKAYLLLGLALSMAWTVPANGETTAQVKSTATASAKRGTAHLNQSGTTVSERRELQNVWKTLQTNRTARQKPVKVVYFRPADAPADSGWFLRLQRTLQAVSDFYAEEFKRFGLPAVGVPFERDDRGIRIHLLRGDSCSKAYGIASAPLIEQEIRRKLSDRIQLDQDHILVLNDLCNRQADGTYLFHSPYHGWGNREQGICHAADCPVLDADRLTDNTSMVFSEMMVQRKSCSIAEFNSWYIGGIAHEMGHIFGLPHDFGGPGEFGPKWISLMGEYGSRHFRDNLWNGSPSARFSRAGILQLMAHPVFSGRLTHPETPEQPGKAECTVSTRKGQVVLHVSLKQNIPYGIVVLLRQEQQSEYLNESRCVVTRGRDSLEVNLGTPGEGDHVVRLMLPYANGRTGDISLFLHIDADGTARLQDVNERLRFKPEKLLETLKKQPSNPVIRQLVGILEDNLHPRPTVDPAACSDDSLWLSDAAWEKAIVGWGVPARNHFDMEYDATYFLRLCNTFHAKGLYAHSASSYVFRLDGRWKRFSAGIGLRDLAHQQGSARFKVWGDGKELYVSPVMRVNEQTRLEVDVTDIKMLELTTEGTEGHVHNSWAIWVDPLLRR